MPPPRGLLVRSSTSKPSGSGDVGVHKPGTDGTDPNPVERELPGEALSKHQNSGLGSPISGKRRHRKKPGGGRGNHNVPTFPTRDERRNKRTQSVDDSPKVDVKHPPPVLLRGVEKPPGDSDPGIGHDDVRHPVLSEHMLSEPPHAGTVSNINEKSSTPDLGSSPLSSREVDVSTKHITPLRPKSESGGPPNPTPSPGDKCKLPSQLPTRPTNPSPPKLPRSTHPPNMINKLGDHPSNNHWPMPNSPVLPSDRPPPKPLTPGQSSIKEGGGDEGIPSKSHLLNRRTNHPSPRPRDPPNHIGPIKLNPVPSIPIPSPKPPTKSRQTPDQLRHPRNLKPGDVPGAQELPANIPPPSPPHPVPNLIEIRPRDGREGSEELRPLSNSGPPLNRPPVMTNEMHSLPKTVHNSDKIPNERSHPVPLTPTRRT